MNNKKLPNNSKKFDYGLVWDRQKNKMKYAIIQIEKEIEKIDKKLGLKKVSNIEKVK